MCNSLHRGCKSEPASSSPAGNVVKIIFLSEFRQKIQQKENVLNLAFFLCSATSGLDFSSSDPLTGSKQSQTAQGGSLFLSEANLSEALDNVSYIRAW